MSEVDALLDVALQALNRGLEQSLLLVGNVAQDVDGLLGAVGLETCQHTSETTTHQADGTATYAKLDGDREEVDARLLLDLLAAGNAREVDVAGLNEALGALGGLEELLSEPKEGEISASASQKTVALAVRGLTCSRHRPSRGWQNQRRPWP